ncbi:MAG: DUF4440 domain-containing protein [Saprospiraceae bacterium]
MKTLNAILFIAFVSFTSCKQAAPVEEAAPAPVSVDMTQVKADIQKFEDQWADVLNKRDLTSLMAMYADDAISMPNDAPIISGKAAIQAQQEKEWAEDKNNFVISFETLDVYGDGDIVTEFGKTTVKDADGAVKYTGKYACVFKKVGDNYLCIREIYNSDAKSK